MRILYIALCLIFVAFTAVQYNDPDFYFWMPVYLTPAAWAGVAAWRPAGVKGGAARPALWACLLAAVAGTAWFWPTDDGFWRQDVWWDSETAREGMGMMIVTVGLLLVALGTAGGRRAGDRP
jgi:hypothetical protein